VEVRAGVAAGSACLRGDRVRGESGREAMRVQALLMAITALLSGGQSQIAFVATFAQLR